MKKKVRFTKATPFQERQYAAQQEAEFDGAVADTLINLGLAEEVRAAAPEIDFDEEILARAVGNAVQEVMRQQAPPAERTAPAITQPGERGAAAVQGDRAPNHQRRAVQYIRAQILSKADNMEERRTGLILERDLKRQLLSMPDQQLDEESRAAAEIISESGLSKRAQIRIRHVMGDYDEGVRALRAQERTERTMSTLSDAAGGYLLPQPFLADLFVYIETYGYVRGLFRFVPMISNELKYRNIGTKPTAAWYGELERILASDLAFGEGGLNAAKLAGITSLSRELEEDAMIAILPLYTALMGEAMALKEDQAGIMGNGTATYGGHRGVLDLTGTGEASVYTLGSGQTGFEDITIEDLLAIRNSISRTRRRNARWLLPEAAVTGLITLKRNNEANNFLLLDPNNAGAISRFLGYPLVDPEGVDDDLFPAAAVSTVFGAFGDFSRSLFGQRRGVTIEASREAVLNDAAGAITLNSFQQDAVLVKATERVAIGHPQPDAYALIKTAAS